MGFSISDARLLLNIHTITSRRILLLRCLLNKVLYGPGAEELRCLLNENVKTTDRRLRHNNLFILPSINSNFGRRRFTFQAITAQNNNAKLDDILSFELELSWLLIAMISFSTLALQHHTFTSFTLYYLSTEFNEHSHFRLRGFCPVEGFLLVSLTSTCSHLFFWSFYFIMRSTELRFSSNPQ